MKPLVKTSAGLGLVGLLVLVGLASVPAADAPEAAYVVVDANGKEHSLSMCKITLGTRHLGWLAPPPKDAPMPMPRPKPGEGAKTPVGPEALEVRDDLSLTPPLIAGFLTLIPVESVKSVVFDDNEVMTVRVAGDTADVISGSAKYKAINKITFEAEIDKGDLGIAEIKFQGGIPKGIKSFRVAKPKPLPELKGGKTATVTTNDAKKTAHKVVDLQPLYKSAEGERLVPTLFFKKTVKIDLDKITKIKTSADSKESDGGDWTLTLKQGGDEETLSLLKQVTIDGKPATLEGLVGRVPVGYKLFPPGTILEVQFE